MSESPIPELPPDIEALLRDARGVHEAPPAERRKVAARLALTTGLMIPGATLAGAKVAVSSWAVKALGVALVVAVGAGTIAVATTHAPTPRPRAHAATTAPVAIAAPRATTTVTTVAPSAASAATPTPAPTPAPTGATRAPSPAPPRVPSHSDTTDDGLADEVSLIQQARDALARGDTRRARAALAAHTQDFPRGHLVPEREALRVRALVESGDHEGAEAARQRFHQRFPDSVLGVAVDRAVAAAR